MNLPDDRIERVLFGDASEPDKTPNPKRKNYVPVSLLVLSLVFLGGFYFLRQWETGKVMEVKKDVEVKDDARVLIEEVSKLISLPQDEEPTIATVSDPKLLKDQAFFANAKTGDKVLIYTKAKKAILYDPVNKKIIEVAPLNIKK